MRVALDVDGCCLNWFKNACNILGLPLVANCWNVPQITNNWDQISKDERFFMNLETLSKPNFEFDVYLTSIPEQFTQHRIDNLKQNGFPDKPVVVEHNKLQYCIDNNIDLIIDDKPETIRQFVAAGKEAIQVYPYYSRYGVIHTYWVPSLEYVPEILETLKTWKKVT